VVDKGTVYSLGIGVVVAVVMTALLNYFGEPTLSPIVFFGLFFGAIVLSFFNIYSIWNETPIGILMTLFTIAYLTTVISDAALLSFTLTTIVGTLLVHKMVLEEGV
jgi:hypothetical protein